MRLEQLSYLVDIISSHSITNTAQRFFVTQQAVSSSLKQLENEMGATLLERRPSGVVLTKQGKIAAEFAQRVLDDLQKTQNKIAALEDDRPASEGFGHIRICSASILNNIVMPKVINILAKRQKNLTVNIIETEPKAILQQLLEQKCDIGLLSVNTAFLQEQSAKDCSRKLHCKMIMKDQLVACMNINSPYAQQERIGMKQMESANKALYGIIPLKQFKKSAVEGSLICSNDVTFHRQMLMQSDIFILMPQLAYTQLFKSKKFTAKPLALSKPVPIAHCLLYRYDANENIHDFITLFDECVRQ